MARRGTSRKRGTRASKLTNKQPLLWELQHVQRAFTKLYWAFGPTLAASRSSCANQLKLKQPKRRHSSRTLFESAEMAVEDIHLCKVTQSPRYKINTKQVPVVPHKAVAEVSKRGKL